MSAPRKKKPGPKRRTGRPATAQRRADNTQRQKAHREALQEVGYVVMQIVCPAEKSGYFRRESQVARLNGLIAVAHAAGDEDEARRQELRLEAMRLTHAAEVRAEMKAKADREAEEWRQIEAHKRRMAAEVDAKLKAAKPSWMA